MNEYFSLALKSIKHRKIRAWLTILGIVIGIAAIIALISISDGLETAITTQFEVIGSNRIYVFPGRIDMAAGTAGMQGLTIDDAEVLRRMHEIETVDDWLFVADSVTYRNEQQFSQYLRGMNLDLIEKMWTDYELELEEGRWPKPGETNIAVIGYRVAHDMFNRKVNIGNRLEIKDVRFEVISIFEPLGTEDDDYSIMISIDQMRELYDKPNEVSAMEIHVKKGVNIQHLAERIQQRLERSRGDDYFTVITPEQILEQFNTILNILKIALGGIALIALIVGGLGIMNVMYTNVLERTKEIGIMKSVGAGYNQILKIFIFESAIIGAIGGVIGAILGTAISFAVEKATKMQGFKYMEVQIDPWLIFLGISFAIIIGIISGYLPAKKGAKLKPIEALQN